MANKVGPDNPGVIAPPPLIALAPLLVGLLLDWLLPAYVLSILSTFWERLVPGALLIAGGMALVIIANLKFREVGTNVEPWKPALGLATGGIYGHVRNPIYVGLGLIVVGLALALNSDWTLVLAIPAALVLHNGVVLREERYLEAKFGDTYRRYKDSVPRYGWRFI